YLIALLYGSYYVVGHLIGKFPSSSDFAVQFLIMPEGFYLLGRFMNALAMILAFLVFYKTLRFLVKPLLSFLLTLLLMFSLHVFEFTFWMVPDAVLLLGSVIVFHYMVKNYFRNLKWTEIVAASLICGLTISTKYNAGFLAPAWLLALILKENFSGKQRIKRLLISGGIVLAGFLMGTPYWLIEFSEFKSGFYMITSQARFSYNIQAGIPYFWEISDLIRTEWLLGILMLGVLLAYFYRLNKLLLPFFLVTLATFLYAGSWEKKGWDYLLVLYPGLLISLAWWLKEVSENRLVKRALLSLIIFSLVLNIPRVLYQNFLHTRQDTRQLASAWIMENIPAGSSICYDHYHYDLNLIDIGRYTEYGEGSRLLSDKLKEKLEIFRDSPRNYRFISAQKDLDMPRIENIALLEEVKSDTFLWQVYTHPHKTLAEIETDSAQILILNSLTVRKFLENQPPPGQNPLREDFLNRRNFYEKVIKALE
ncbi:MAG: phospholipid carrier-dependent glycosyltransferase, partial [Calditrichaeota bacterium]